MKMNHQFSKKCWELLLLALLLGGTTTFVSCSNDDNPSAEKWELPDVEPRFLTAADRRENPTEAERAKYQGYGWRVEVKDGVEEIPYRLRSCSDAFDFDRASSKELPDTSYVPSREGFDGLRMSGSARFSAGQLAYLADWLKQKAGNKPVFIVDLRSESHGIINGHHMAWFGLQNWANIGKTTEEVLPDEQQQLNSIKGQTILYGKIGSSTNYVMADSTYAVVAQALTEREAVEAYGLRYRRFAALDHTFPTDAIIDDFLAFFRSLPQDCWLHFHCYAGQGRTTLFMCLTDMLCNPGVALKDILYRQCLIGGISMYNVGIGKPQWRQDLYTEIKQMMPVFYQYVRENRSNGYSVRWSDWKKRRYKL